MLLNTECMSANEYFYMKFHFKLLEDKILHKRFELYWSGFLDQCNFFAAVFTRFPRIVLFMLFGACLAYYMPLLLRLVEHLAFSVFIVFTVIDYYNHIQKIC